MIRFLAAAPPLCQIPKLREEAAARWSWRSFIDVRDAGAAVVLDFEDANPPMQADVDALVAAHDPSPAPPPVDQTAFDAAVAQLRATFNTARTAAQLNDSVDALTVLMRRVFRELSA